MRYKLLVVFINVANSRIANILEATDYKYFITSVFIYNKESSVISVLNNIKV